MPTSVSPPPSPSRTGSIRRGRALRLLRVTLVLPVTLGLAAPAVAATDTAEASGLDLTLLSVATDAPAGPDASLVDGFIVEVRADRRPEHVRDRVSQLAGGRANLGAGIGGGARTLDLDGSIDVDEAERIADRLEREGLVVSATPDVRISSAGVPNDPHYGYQWSLSDRFGGSSAYGVGAEVAWGTTVGSSDVVVAVLDTGTLAHPDIADRLVPGYDLVDGDTDASDPGDWCDARGTSSTWHGTHVAGTVGATTGNGVGVAGVDQRARIQPVRVLGPCGGNLSDILAGIRWAAGLPVDGLPRNPTPADVLNLSLGGQALCGTATQAAVDAAVAAGSLVVAAAGNDNVDAGTYTPANCNNVLAVAATSPAGDRSFYSNHGAVVDIAAPGGDSRYGSPDGYILSLGNTGTTVPSSMNYQFKQGTSMAAPHVAGVASLALAADPTLTPADLAVLLRSTATSFPTTSAHGSASVCSSDPAATYHCGAGIVDAAAALAAVTGGPEPGTEPEPEPEPAPAAPAWPDGARLAFDLEADDIRLTWPQADGTVDTYDVLRDGKTIASTTRRTALITGLKADQRYHLEVRARNVSGTSARIGRHLTPTAGFSDVASTSRFRIDIEWLATAETTRGCGDDRFCPTDAVTRQQMAAFLTRSLGLTATSGITFSDVPSGSRFATDIDKLATAGITLGCGGDRFCPGTPVTRQQMAAFLSRGLDLTATSGITFSDVPSSSKFVTDIDKLATAGITLGCSEDRFCPGASVLRQQMAAFLRRG